MKSVSILAAITASFALAAACSSSTDATAPGNGMADPTDDTAVDDRPSKDASAAKDSGAPDECPAALPEVSCTTIKSPPTSVDAIDSFLKENAVPLRCAEGSSDATWNLQPLIDLYGENKMFMLGEVHGSNEIGILSAKILTALAEKNLVNVVGMELPMDYAPDLQRYVNTGSPSGDSLFGDFATNFFGRILPTTARELKQKGIALTIACVDYPQDPNGPIATIQQIATKLSAQKTTVLATLPAAISYPPTTNELKQVDDYYALLTSKKSSVCTELSAAECDHLYVMLNALWVSAKVGEADGDSDEWFARRETVIYFNMRQSLGEADRMYLHMGSFHTNKFDSSAGSLMAHDYALTKDKVFSVAPAYGDKSVIWYAGEKEQLDGEPASIIRSLAATTLHPHYVSTTRPNAACEGNPLGVELETEVTESAGKRAEMYDGYIHYGVLTSEEEPSKATLELRSSGSPSGRGGSRFAQYRAAVAAREAAVLGVRR